jgi:hypothetical protein
VCNRAEADRPAGGVLGEADRLAGERAIEVDELAPPFDFAGLAGADASASWPPWTSSTDTPSSALGPARSTKLPDMIRNL